MEMTGTRHMAAPRGRVWERLNDAETLKACIPGCQGLTGSLEEGFEATVVQKVGPVKATFKGTVSILDVIPQESYRLEGAGKGGVAGFANGSAVVRLADAEDGGTDLSYEVAAQVGGKLAQLGARLIDGVAKKLAEEFFDRFRSQVEDEDAAA